VKATIKIQETWLEYLSILPFLSGRQLSSGKQAANTLQPTSTSQHPTTPDAKVEGTITASPLVTRRPCLFHTAAIGS